MKLIVTHEDGRTETLSLRGPVSVVCGKFLNRLVSDGVEYFFTYDGHYDGWGAKAPCGKDGADEIARAMEEKRTLDPN
jgi:hypothetical protein